MKEIVPATYLPSVDLVCFHFYVLKVFIQVFFFKLFCCVNVKNKFKIKKIF
jgi:hypothetical protein